MKKHKKRRSKSRHSASFPHILAFFCALLGFSVFLKYGVLKPLGAHNLIDPAVPTATAPAAFPSEALPPAAGATVPSVSGPAAEPPTAPSANDPAAPSDAAPVALSWYDDALFIGDSRICGLRDYERIGNAEFFAAVGMTVFNYDEQWASDYGFRQQKLFTLLAERTYGKIFINLGLNECGYNWDKIISSYEDLVEKVKEAQPDAVIILQGIMTVGRSKVQETSYFHPDNLFALNERIAALADNKTVFYIDVNPDFADEEGFLRDGLSGDGCHLYAKYNTDWAASISYAVAQLGI